MKGVGGGAKGMEGRRGAESDAAGSGAGRKKEGNGGGGDGVKQE